jgi:drug/metabolite transporter (DMT)-like permease
MYGNDYSVSLQGVALWLAVAALVGGGIECIRQRRLRKRIAFWWSLFPAVAMATLFAILYLILPADRYGSPPGWHWLEMLSAAAVLSLAITPPWAVVVWLSGKTARRLRGKWRDDADSS